MFKLFAALLLSVAWITIFAIGVSRVQLAGDDGGGDDGGDAAVDGAVDGAARDGHGDTDGHADGNHGDADGNKGDAGGDADGNKGDAGGDADGNKGDAGGDADGNKGDAGGDADGNKGNAGGDADGHAATGDAAATAGDGDGHASTPSKPAPATGGDGDGHASTPSKPAPATGGDGDGHAATPSKPAPATGGDGDGHASTPSKPAPATGGDGDGHAATPSKPAPATGGDGDGHASTPSKPAPATGGDGDGHASTPSKPAPSTGGDGDGHANGDADGHRHGIQTLDGDDGDGDADGNKGDADGNKGDADGNKGDADGNKGDGDDGNGDADGKKGDGDDGDGGADGHKGGDGDDGDADGAAGGDGHNSGVWRPKYGVVDGQGCTGCAPGTKNPYYIWTKFVPGNKHWKGGMIYFEWRGDSGDIIAVLLFSWIGLFLVIAVVAIVLQLLNKTYQFPLCGPLKAKSPLWYLDFYAPIPLRTTWAEFIMGMWILGWLGLCFAYVFNHATINNLVGKVPRGLGGVVAGMLTLQLFPVARKSLLLLAFGIPFERALKFHKKLGFWILIFMTAHGLGMWLAHVQYYDNGSPNWSTRTYTDTYSTSEAVKEGLKRIIKWEIGFPHGPPLAGLLAWVAALFVVLPAAFLRRSHWNLFVVLHTLYAVLYIFAWIHYPTLMIFSGIPVLLYAIDVLIRYYESHTNRAEVLGIERFGNVVKLTLHKKGISELKPFQWVSLKNSDMGAQEWHPFSISTAREETFTLHIRDMGPGEWTHDLRQVSVGDQFACQGPFGRPMVQYDMEGRSEIYLCAGGIGFTAILSMIDFHASQRYVKNSNVRLIVIWAFRGRAGYEPFAKELRALSQVNGVEWQLYNTSASEASMLNSKGSSYYTSQSQYENPLNNANYPEKEADYHSDIPFPTMFGRPNWSAVLDHAQPGSAVFACGPGGLIYDVESAAVANNVPLHKEVFEL